MLPNMPIPPPVRIIESGLRRTRHYTCMAGSLIDVNYLAPLLSNLKPHLIPQCWPPLIRLVAIFFLDNIVPTIERNRGDIFYW